MTTVSKPPDREVVCLCGSTRFQDEFQELELKLAREGAIVVSVVGFFKSDHEDEWNGITDADKEAFDELHLDKIDLADRVLVVNPGGYVGESTRREIAHAMTTGTNVDWYEQPRRANAGGCWICLTGNGHENDEMPLDPEFDAYYHPDCLEATGYDSIVDYEGRELLDDPVIRANDELATGLGWANKHMSHKEVRPSAKIAFDRMQEAHNLLTEVDPTRNND